MSPRVSDADAARTRAGIVRAAVTQASNDGLEAITIGRLADDLGMSKAGVIGPFGSKEQLQLDTLKQAIEMFTADVWEPATRTESGLPRLEKIIDQWIAHLKGGTFPGGCFLTQTAAEFDGRPGPVRDATEDASRRWERVLASEVRTAVDQGDLPANTDPAQVAFEIAAIAQGTNQAIQLRREPEAPERGRRAMRRFIGLA
ncbi:MAG: TetR/AcrR family transcriptional regulator [Actinomycetota bacterium]|nr:TetR/AcrR family transcriptional regulator [Actinomycetota bacterium]